MGRKSIKREISVEVDKLTNSIEDVHTGKVYDTEFYRMTEKDKKQIERREWFFDWQDEIKYSDREVYKLVIIDNPDVIQGLISLKIDDKFVFIYLAENAKFNVGKTKMYTGVAGNLFAHACRRSWDLGFEGFVVFMAKTKLINHYKNTLGAELIGGQRMTIESENAKKLIEKYFNS